jgi:cobalt-zinc-cadmium efflux system outer membrane protein
VLNRGKFEALPWPVRGELRHVDANSQVVINALREANPELAAIDMELEAARYRVTVAKKNFWPDVGVGVDWIQTDKASMPVHDSGKDAVILMFSMNLPVWRDSYKAGQREAEANVRKITSERVQTENTLLATALRVLYDYQDSGRKVNLYGASLVPKAEELLGASESAYQAGTVDFLSLIDAQRTLLGFELLHERALTDNQQRLAELEMLAGTELGAGEYKSGEGRTTDVETR